MLGFDLGETKSVTAFGVEWKIGLLPLGKYEELHLAFTEAYFPIYSHTESAHRDAINGEVLVEGSESCTECREVGARASLKLAPIYRELFRWGVKGWAAPKLPFESENENYLGQGYDCVKKSVVERLARISRGDLVRSLALEVMRANNLTAEEVLGFK
jgi:hypothetical protein